MRGGRERRERRYEGEKQQHHAEPGWQERGRNGQDKRVVDFELADALAKKDMMDAQPHEQSRKGDNKRRRAKKDDQSALRRSDHKSREQSSRYAGSRGQSKTGLRRRHDAGAEPGHSADREVDLAD